MARMSRPLTIVIKLGTSSIVDEVTHEPHLSILSAIVETVVRLQNDGHRVVIVSSGAIGVGMRRMNIPTRPKHLPQIQALAAIGQFQLMAMWDQQFSLMRRPVAQVLLTRSEIADRTQYDNARQTFLQLLEMNVVPIVNENDTLSVSEIKFGDNDTLSAITAGMVHADYLFLMTDVDCLYTTNPRVDPTAKPIQVVDDIDTLEADVSSRGSSLGTGGMFTKIVAARRATSAAVTTVITRASKPGNIRAIIKNAEGTLEPTAEVPLHTRFLPAQHPVRDRHFWLLHIFPPSGNIYIDEQAYKAIRTANLFPSGVVDVDGIFAQQEAVRVFVVKRKDRTGANSGSNSPATPLAEEHRQLPAYDLMDSPPLEVGRCIVNYASVEIKRIMGLQASQIHSVLGYADSEYISHRQNIALFSKNRSWPSTPQLGPTVTGLVPIV